MEAAEESVVVPFAPPEALEDAKPLAENVSADDFYAYLPDHKYIFTPTGKMWGNAGVNARLPPVKDGVDKDGNDKWIGASVWLDRHRRVDDMTWMPGAPMIIEDRLVSGGGWTDHAGVKVYNLYKGPNDFEGDPALAEPWLDHIAMVYPDDYPHILKWLAQRVQQPGNKINHALVLGGPTRIGKDTILEPVKQAVGPWNFIEAGPAAIMGRFNGFVKSVILRVSEARDLGSVDRFGFYDHMKTYTAAPPDVLTCDEKNVREYSVPNVTGVIITTNHKQDGIYLPADDRRHYVCWSERVCDDFDADYWTNLYGWYADGGIGHVVAFLKAFNLTGFNPKAPPPRTAAFQDIVDANRAPEDAELTDAIEACGNPDALTIFQVSYHCSDEFREWLLDRRNSRVIPHRLEAVGYVAVRKPSNKGGMWKIDGRRQAVYAKRELPLRDQIVAAMKLSKEI